MMVKGRRRIFCIKLLFSASHQDDTVVAALIYLHSCRWKYLKSAFGSLFSLSLEVLNMSCRVEYGNRIWEVSKD